MNFLKTLKSIVPAERHHCFVILLYTQVPGYGKYTLKHNKYILFSKYINTSLLKHCKKHVNKEVDTFKIFFYVSKQRKDLFKGRKIGHTLELFEIH